MAFEIERKFLVRDEGWRASVRSKSSIRQAYLARNRSLSLRVRIRDDCNATLTIKSAGAEIRRLEFEYEIPLADAEALLALREGAIIEKLRYKVPQGSLMWEVDVFKGENMGLVIAEIELPHEEKVFERPAWIDSEVTSYKRYSNASLAVLPFCQWPDQRTDSE